MSIEASKAAWKADCPGNLKIVLLALADFASEKNNYTCMAGLETLAEMVNTSERQVRANLRKLEQLGLIVTTLNRGRSNTNVYDLSPIVKPEVDFPFSENKTGSLASKNRKSSVKKPEVDFPLSFNNQKEPLVDKGGDIEILEKHFTSVSGILPGKSNYDFGWKEPLQLYLDNAGSLDKAKTKIERAVGIARGGGDTGKHYKLVSPRSLATIIANMQDDVSNTIKVSAI